MHAGLQMKIYGLKSIHLVLCTICLITLIGIIVTFSDKGLLELYQTKNRCDSMLRSNEELRKKNEELCFEIERLKCDRYVELLARRELGMIKDGEVIYQFEEDIEKAR
jgi:cell division protein FtsB